MTSIKLEANPSVQGRELQGTRDVRVAPPGEEIRPVPRRRPLFATAPATDAMDVARPPLSLTSAPNALGVRLPLGSARGVGNAARGQPLELTAGVAAARGAAAATAVAAVQEAPVPYSVPPDAEVKRASVGKKILAGAGIALFAPFYLLFAALAFVPSLVAGAIEAPKKDEKGSGKGTFFYGFSELFRTIMDHVFPFAQRPMQSLIDTVSNARGVFFVDKKTDPSSTIITIRVHLDGDPKTVEGMKQLEGNMEDHLAIPGYKVNVEFVDRSGPDVNEVHVDPKVWSSVHHWNPYDDDTTIDPYDAYMMSHETMHLLGLPDEYDYAEHFTNEHMGFFGKLGVFFSRLVQRDLPSDSASGIMRYSSRKPLPRQYRAVLES